jgi:co-chaperonin GroES (HSP10)
MKLKPIGKNVILSVLDGGKVTESGIILKVSINPDRGLVEAVGGDVTQVKVGDEVFLDWNNTIEIDSTEYRLISEDNIIWVYND